MNAFTPRDERGHVKLCAAPWSAVFAGGQQAPRALYFCPGQLPLPWKVLPSQPQYVARSRVHGGLGLHVHVLSQPASPAQISPFAQSRLVVHVFAAVGAEPSTAAAFAEPASAASVAGDELTDGPGVGDTCSAPVGGGGGLELHAARAPSETSTKAARHREVVDVIRGSKRCVATNVNRVLPRLALAWRVALRRPARRRSEARLRRDLILLE